MLDISKLRKREDIPVDKLEKAMLNHFIVFDGMKILDEACVEPVLEVVPEELPKELEVVQSEDHESEHVPDIEPMQQEQKPRSRKMSVLDVLSSDIVFEDGKNAYGFSEKTV